jgi:hypothetical protein
MQPPIEHHLEYALGACHITFRHGLMADAKGKHSAVREHTTVSQGLDDRLNMGGRLSKDANNACGWVKGFAYGISL